jgi:hypothetical protein
MLLSSIPLTTASINMLPKMFMIQQTAVVHIKVYTVKEH